MKKTEQMEFWKGQFGKEYNERNSFSQEEWDQFYINNWGVTKIEMNAKCIGDLPKDIKILEVGANIGMQLAGLQRMGFTNLYGIELQQNAVEVAKQNTKGINVIQGSAFDIPFKDGYFDLVFTSGVLIHISPNDLPNAMDEMYRCSNKYIWGFEYFAETITDINYRGNTGFLWKADYAQLFLDRFNDLDLVKKDFYKYTNEDNVDCMYLLSK
ncbi:MAG: pseudaminic acid biosynthesis-associated methylase [Bacteroidia bacterium]